MKNIYTKTEFPMALALVLAAALVGATTVNLSARDAAGLRKKALEVVAPLPAVMPGAEADTPAQVALGKQLYFDKRLSKNNSQSCNSCHAVDNGKAGVDNEPTSPGAFGKRGDRNSPTTLNAGFHLAQFWDGRAPDLKAQAKGPVLSSVEMAMPDEAAVVERLRSDKQYARSFKAAFPGQADPITYDNMAQAISAFERTLITHDRFDQFLKGKDDALTAAELNGLNTFLTVGCTTCHYGPALGGKVYQKVGLIKPYANQSDPGRFNVTKDDSDKLKFKVPSLRNVAATYPYFHDGKVASLPEAVRTMAAIQLGLDLTSEQEQSLVAFLRSLTGEGINLAKSL
jgi:cytochrome c peroxidase